MLLMFTFCRENLPSHFKYKEYCPVVFRKLRERFGITEKDYLVITCLDIPFFCLDTLSCLPFYLIYITVSTCTVNCNVLFMSYLLYGIFFPTEFG